MRWLPRVLLVLALLGTGHVSYAVGAAAGPSTEHYNPTTDAIHDVERGSLLSLQPAPTPRDIAGACPLTLVPGAGFTDVALSDVHRLAIDCAVWWNVANGSTGSRFNPSVPVTRDQLASFLARLIEESGGTLPTAPVDAFDDDDGSVHEARINQLAAADIVSGTGRGTYAPREVVRRDQMARFLVRSYSYRNGSTLASGEDAFADDDGNIHEDSINAAAEAGFTAGSAGGSFQPAGDVARNAMSSFLVRVLDKLVLDAAAELPAHVARISAGSTSETPVPDGTWSPDTGYGGGRVKVHSSTLAITGTDQDWLYQKHRYNMGTYDVGIPSATTYRVDLHFAENIFKAPGERVFDVKAEGRVVVDNLDVFAEAGRTTAHVRAVDVQVNDGVLNLEFVSAGSGYPFVSGIEVRQTELVTSTPPPTTPPPATPPPDAGEFPTPGTTGFRVPESSLEEAGSITSSHDGQVIEGKDITGNVRIQHDNVTVRDSRINFTATYGLNVRKKADGSCPVGSLFEHVEVNGALADESFVPVYGAGCAWTLDHAYVHNVGRAIKVVNDNVVTNSYIVSSKTGDSGSHRGAVGNNGGRNNKLVNNVLMCEGTGCSAAIPMYGDFAPVDGMLVQHNLLATTGSYCAYGGSLSGKRYPDGSDIKFIDNHFSTRYFSTCGRYGYLSGFEGGVRGNEFRGNVWHESGAPIG